MAQHKAVIYLDDIDGTKAAETISFGLDGTHYEIDVNTRNARNLRKTLAEFIEAGRPVRAQQSAGAQGRRRTDKAAKVHREELAAIRLWAAENGIAVAARGRLSEIVKERYAAADTTA